MHIKAEWIAGHSSRLGEIVTEFRYCCVTNLINMHSYFGSRGTNIKFPGVAGYMVFSLGLGDSSSSSTRTARVVLVGLALN